MIRLSRRSRTLILLPALCLILGCPAAPVPPVPPVPPAPIAPGTTSAVQFPETEPPILTKQVADKIQAGTAQEAVIAILVEAAEEEASAKGIFEPVVTQSKLNPIRLDLTLTQGKRKLVLGFKSNVLASKSQEGLD